MGEITPNSFPTLLEKYLQTMNRFYPSTVQLVILSYLAAQTNPLPESYILQKLLRIYPKHTEKMLLNELRQLVLKKIIWFDSEQRYWVDLHYIQTEFDATFLTMEADFAKANPDVKIMSLFMQLKKQVMALQENMLQILPTFYQTRNKDLKKFIHNIIRKYGLDTIYTAFEQQMVGKSIDFIALSESLTHDLTQKISEIPPTIRAPLGRNIYNAYRKVKTYNETAKGTRLFFYSEKITDTTNADNPSAIHKDSIVFGVPRIGERIFRDTGNKSKKKKEKGNSVIPSKENILPLDTDASNNEKTPHSIENQPILNSNSNSLIEIQEKRRGRPPKPKDNTPMESVPPRPRGRPPKPKQLESLPDETLFPRPRGRPPKPKQLESLPDETIFPRPQGRPPKSKLIERPTGESPPSHPLSSITDEAKLTPIIISSGEIEPFLTILETKYGQFGTRSQIIAAVTESVSKLTTNYNRASNIRMLILLHYFALNRNQPLPKLAAVLQDLNISPTQFETQKTRFLEWGVISSELSYEFV